MANNFSASQFDEMQVRQLQKGFSTGVARDRVKIQLTDTATDFGSFISNDAAAKATVEDVQTQQFVSVTPEKNVTVAERLSTSPALNAKQYAESGLQELVLRLMALNPVGQPYTGVNLRDINISGYLKETPEKKFVDVKLHDLTVKNVLIPDESIKFNESSFTTPGQTAPDQGAHFYQAVSAVDSHIIILRQIEVRIAQYKQLLEQAKALQAQLEDWHTQADRRLAVNKGEITSARYHIAVASQLKDEEQKRIDDVNARRLAILERVEVVIFHKQRMTNRFTTLPVVKASSFRVNGKLQIPLRDLESVPPEISEIAQHFRAAPLAWFPALEALPQYFDRPVMLFNAFEHVKLRATNPIFANVQMMQAGGGFIGAARNIIGLQVDRARDWRKAGMYLDTRWIDQEGLTASYRRLRQAATLGDMIDGGHGSAKASRLAAGQLDDLRKAAESLYASFADTSAKLRLAWAEALLDDMGQASFKALHTLPGWLSIDVDLRREQQGLVDLLYHHVYATNEEAVTAINRLILVALLVAAHAPVSQLIGATMVRPVAAHPGVIFDLNLNSTRARIGMAVTVQNRPGEITARAVIDDIVGDRVQARLVAVSTPGTSLALGAIVQLSEGEAFKSPISSQLVSRIR